MTDLERLAIVKKRLIKDGKVKNITDFALKLGYKRPSVSAILNGLTPISDNFLEKLEIAFDINKRYITEGYSDIYLDQSSHNRLNESDSTYQPNDKSKFKSRKRIPYYDIDASGGDVTMFSDNPETPAGFLEEFFDDCDFAMNLWGHSMFPDYSSGEVIVLKQIFDKDQILFGEAYLIVTDELRTVKYIRKSNKGDDFIMLVPKNEKYYDPIDLHKAKVTQIFLVKGKIVRNA